MTHPASRFLSKVGHCFAFAALCLLKIISAVQQVFISSFSKRSSGCIFTVELQWLEHLWNHEKWFEPGVVRANEG